eukprot:CAMPEP_0179456688 /NCGR_PEP_ID=MMETSP0799-20121207/40567_1 /TAXON_ID=46947 /ORGANISM="Geminigera cryophila, Strain CCMP2564" /LENGTH=76 /DNA_ID=CAMNT_0021256847 /DNA_START=103 /DNA_END=330 /DNA_ORIENTATION=+
MSKEEKEEAEAVGVRSGRCRAIVVRTRWPSLWRLGALWKALCCPACDEAALLSASMTASTETFAAGMRCLEFVGRP